jgi:hypothetical protein
MVRQVEPFHGARSLGAAALLVLGITACYLAWSLGGGGSRHNHAESLVLRDSQGRVRARLVADSSGVAKIALLDARGNDRVALRASAGDEASVELYENGRIRISLYAGSDGESRVILSNGNGELGARMVAGPGQSSRLELGSGVTQLQLGGDSEGTSQIKVTDSDGRVLGVIDPAMQTNTALQSPPPLSSPAPPPARDFVPGRSPNERAVGQAPPRGRESPSRRRPQSRLPASP